MYIQRQSNSEKNSKKDTQCSIFRQRDNSFKIDLNREKLCCYTQACLKPHHNYPKTSTVQ